MPSTLVGGGPPTHLCPVTHSRQLTRQPHLHATFISRSRAQCPARAAHPSSAPTGAAVVLPGLRLHPHLTRRWHLVGRASLGRSRSRCLAGETPLWHVRPHRPAFPLGLPLPGPPQVRATDPCGDFHPD